MPRIVMQEQDTNEQKKILMHTINFFFPISFNDRDFCSTFTNDMDQRIFLRFASFYKVVKNH